ncbi:polysaccharide pyruvyl transferase family protein [Macellibacteroides fermentans]|uniref:polysaccharide pyruvyl transferase family protein n=1 Tax=Macellibacteroides fermentans TaxID=879969 RepID=UPI00406C73CC
MKKLGLCVRYDCNNYGSMLQVYATQAVIRKMKWDYEIILYDKKNFAFLIKNISRLFNPYFIEDKVMLISKKIKIKRHPNIEQNNSTRIGKIEQYRKKYIGPYSTVYKGYNNLVKGASKYDAIMVGSDQLWTPAGIKSKFYNLIFVPDSIKKISFATSFGVYSIPQSQIETTKYYLDRINYLSVREMQGQEIVKNLIGRNAMVALDPTLMFNSTEWMEMFPDNKMSDEPYILAYFLGTNSEHREAVLELKKKTNLKVITCPHMDDFVESDLDFGDEQRFDVDPVDFLNLIRGASFVATDSFHGSVFSILHHKNFVVFNRFKESEKKSKNSRIDSLCNLLGLEDRRYTTKGNIYNQMVAPIDFAFVDKKLDSLRKETYDFLWEALTENEGSCNGKVNM